MRPSDPEGIKVEAEGFAKEDFRCHRENGVDLNPFSTGGARNEWQRGFDGRPLLNYQGPPEYNRFYQRGRAAARLLEQALVDEAGELGFDIVKDTESDYYMFKARNWVEGSRPIFDTPKEAAQAVIDIYGERK